MSNLRAYPLRRLGFKGNSLVSPTGLGEDDLTHPVGQDEHGIRFFPAPRLGEQHTSARILQAAEAALADGP